MLLFWGNMQCAYQLFYYHYYYNYVAQILCGWHAIAPTCPPLCVKLPLIEHKCESSHFKWRAHKQTTEQIIEMNEWMNTNVKNNYQTITVCVRTHDLCGTVAITTIVILLFTCKFHENNVGFIDCWCFLYAFRGIPHESEQKKKKWNYFICIVNVQAKPCYTFTFLSCRTKQTDKNDNFSFRLRAPETNENNKTNSKCAYNHVRCFEQISYELAEYSNLPSKQTSSPHWKIVSDWECCVCAWKGKRKW